MTATSPLSPETGLVKVPEPESQGIGGSHQRAFRRCVVIVNQAAGGVTAASEEINNLEQRLQCAHWKAQVHLVPPEEIERIVRLQLAEEPTLVVVGGGDGTVRSVAALLAGSHHGLGILPVGTMNRFARTLGIPPTIEEAAQVLVGGHDAEVDLGEVNGHVFLNNCQLGLYPELARIRERRRVRHRHWPKFLRWIVDTVAALVIALRSWRLIHLRVTTEGRRVHYKVPAVLIANNGPSVKRDVTQGMLAVYIPQVSGPLSLAAVTLRATLLSSDPPEPLEVLRVQEIRLDVPARTPVAVDGEVIRMRSPLVLRNRAGACRVRVPTPPPSLGSE